MESKNNNKYIKAIANVLPEEITIEEAFSIIIACLYISCKLCKEFDSPKSILVDFVNTYFDTLE